MRRAIVAVVTLGLSACVAAPPPPPPLAGSPSASSASLKASQAAASASAVHPGDADMSCEAIQAELAQVMNDPAYCATIASMGARSADQKAKIDRAMATHSTKAPADAVGTAQGTSADLEKIMPQVMRSQRLSTLAQGKNCAFMADAHKH